MGSVAEMIRAEVLNTLRGAAEVHRAMDRQELLDNCPTAENAQQVALVLSALKRAGAVKCVATGWLLVNDPADSQPEPDEIPDTGHQATPQAEPEDGSTSDYPTPSMSPDPLVEKVRQIAPQPIREAARKARILRVMAEWPAMDAEVSEYLREIAADIESAAA